MRTRGIASSSELDPAIAEDALTEIGSVIAELRADPQLISALLKEGDCGDLFKKLPQEFRSGPDGGDPTGALALSTYLARAESILGAAFRGSEKAR